MANFIININEPQPEIPIYSKDISYIFLNKCGQQNVSNTYNIKLLDSNNSIFSVLNTYSGDLKSKLYITNYYSNNNILTLKYMNNIITSNMLPIEIDISSLIDTDNIPGLTLDYFQNSLINDSIVNINFFIKTINDAVGDTLQSSFQVKLKKCDNLSSIESTLPIITSNNGTINYQIVANNNPINYYITGLPLGIDYNNITGLIEGNSSQIGVHPITIHINNDNGENIINTTLEVINSNIEIPIITSKTIINIPSSFTTASYQIKATNEPTIYGFLFDPSFEPANPTYSSDNSIIYFKPNLLPIGSYNITITASNSAGIDSETLTINIQ